MGERPFITCHVLNTVTGKPAQGIQCKLAATQEGFTWTALTDRDGRVSVWQNNQADLNEYIATTKKSAGQGERLVFEIQFSTGEYFGYDNTFYPTVNVSFIVKVEEEHYHLPLLLGPWSYTTYRGS